ncbi:MAG: hypothetical protein Q9207_004429 [Kuettlingeria erythrocarpa]
MDRLADDGETVVASAFSMAPGGKGSNSAVAVHRLTRPNPGANQLLLDGEATEEKDAGRTDDVHVRMVGAVGADQFGPELKKNLDACGVKVDGVRVVEGEKTTIANTSLSRRTPGLIYPGVNQSFTASDFMIVDSIGGGVKLDMIIYQLELHREAIEQAIETAGHAGIDVLLNPSPAFGLIPDIYPYITHLIMNETEAMLLSEIEPDDIVHQTGWTKVADHFLMLGVKKVVITLGAKGAYYATEGTRGDVEAEQNLQVIDTSGAGDSFVGGYTAEYMNSKRSGRWDIKAAVQKGCKASARVIERIGCLEPICWADEIDTPATSRDLAT